VRTRLALLLAAAALAPASFASAATTHHASPLAIVRVCGTRFVDARLSWGEKCLWAGELCKVGNREYRRYGFVCPAMGHLRRR
jgi:hypothetical protein